MEELNKVDIMPVGATMPWSCNRCKKLYTRNRAWAIAHVINDDCSPPQPRGARVAPAARAPLVREFGRKRNLRWIDNLRRDLRDQESIVKKHNECAECQQRAGAAACASCFHFQWIQSARNNAEWDKITYSAESGEGDIGKRRRSKWEAPAGDWIDPRQ
jgi:hypothetical protein